MERALLTSCKFYVEGVATSIIGITGIGINVAALIVLIKSRHRHVFQNLLLSLAIYDLVLILLVLACFAIPQFSENYRRHLLIHALPFLIPLAQTVLSCSRTTTVALSVERYMSICKPFRRYASKSEPGCIKGSSSANYILPILALSIVYNLPRYFEWVTIEMPSLHEPQCQQGRGDVAPDEFAKPVYGPWLQEPLGKVQYMLGIIFISCV